ncbi:MAG: HPF/RaiA family ribosome-associated protein [Chitinivibrionales bacterium]|nr:HPF/RaiA family ribosome-associated protein [Chitinivibrionales bacterium]
MNVPLEISYRNVNPTDELDDLIRAKAAKLEEICDYISSCRVLVEQPERHQRTGRPYHVRLDISVPPGHRIAVHQEPKHVEQTDSAQTEIRRAFEEALRQLRKLKDLQRGETKIHEQQRREAVVDRIFPTKGYGFLRTVDNRRIYFHQNAVTDNDFQRLEPGTGVYYNESMGEMGPQATVVKISEKPGVGVKHAGPTV